MRSRSIERVRTRRLADSLGGREIARTIRPHSSYEKSRELVVASSWAVTCEPWTVYASFSPAPRSAKTFSPFGVNS